MAYQISVDVIKTLFPTNKNVEQLTVSFNKILPMYGIDTKLRVAAFLAQCGHESQYFTRFNENLNYSAESLCKTYKKVFTTLDQAKPYHRNPEKIANKVYANKNGNGPESSGDGWKFRGRGCIQLTGKYNYTEFSKHIKKTLDETVLYCETIDGAVESACFFWQENELNRFADKSSFISLTREINGGLNGIEDRTEIYNHALELLD